MRWRSGVGFPGGGARQEQKRRAALWSKGLSLVSCDPLYVSSARGSRDAEVFRVQENDEWAKGAGIALRGNSKPIWMRDAGAKRGKRNAETRSAQRAEKRKVATDWRACRLKWALNPRPCGRRLRHHHKTEDTGSKAEPRYDFDLVALPTSRAVTVTNVTLSRYCERFQVSDATFSQSRLQHGKANGVNGPVA